MAEACSPIDGIWSAIPDHGGPLPSGSRLLLAGSFDPGSIAITIDGDPATLMRDDGLPVKGGFGAAFAIAPTPPEGAVVELRNCSWGSPRCDGADVWTWPVLAPDATAPAPVLGLEYGIYDHVDLDTSGNSCGNGETFDATIYAHATVPGEAAGGAIRQALFQVLDLERDVVLGEVMLDVPSDGGRVDAVLGVPADAPEPLEGRLCVLATVLDLSGNRSEPVSSCDPHHVAIDPDQEEPEYANGLPEEPDWDAFEELEGDDGLTRQGCACTADRGRAGPAVLAGLVLLVAGSCRRSR